MNARKPLLIFLLVLFCIPSRSFAFSDPKPEAAFISTPADLDRSDIRTITDASGIKKLGIPTGSKLVIPNIHSNIGYIVIPMGTSGNNVFLEFSLTAGAPNNYAVAYALASGIAGNQSGSLKSIERILTANYTIKDPAMKYPSQKNIIVKLHSDSIPGSNKNTSGNFFMQQGPSDFINIAIREPANMQRTFIHEFIHFFNRDIIDGNSSVMLSETLTLLFENKCFNNQNYRFCGSTDFYNSITSGGAVDPKKLTDVISEASLAHDNYYGHEYQVAELLGKVLMEKLAVEMPGASIEKRIIEATKRIIAIQNNFSSILPTNIDGEIIYSEKPKALNMIATKLGFSGGFPDMASSINTYYEKNVYADAKKLAGFKYLMEELRLSVEIGEETQLDIPPVKSPVKKLTTAPQSQNITQPLLRIPQRDVIKIFPQLERTASGPVPRMTRAQHQTAMNEWVMAVKNRQTMSVPHAGVLRGIAGTFLQAIGYLPMPSEIIDTATGATPQAWIDVHGADIKNVEAKISDINDMIVNLETRRDSITPVSSKPKNVSMKGDDSLDRQRRINALQTQINALYKNRDEWMDKIGWLLGRIREETKNKIQDEYDAMLSKKKYINNRYTQPVY